MLISQNLRQRFFVAIALLPPVLGAVVYAGPWFFLLLGVVSLLIAYEWNTITRQKLRGLLTLIAVILGGIASALGTLLGGLSRGDASMVIIALVGALVAAFVLSTLEAPLLGDLADEDPDDPANQTHEHSTALGRPNSFRWAIAGYPYIIMALLSIAWIRTLDDHGLLVIWLFFVVWATDVGGYFFGKGIGGPKLAPKISPKKTWAGFLGGVFLAVVVSWVGHLILEWHPTPGALWLVPVLATVSQLGDLFESYVKRRFEAKDSGSAIPGHGGLMDRIDGLMFAAPCLALMLAVHFTGQDFGT